MESLSAFSSMSDLPSFSRDDIRYAAEMTRVVYEPDRRIDTFGDTRFNFLLLSELMDEVNVVRVRSGWVEAEKPKIIRPSIYNEISTNARCAAKQFGLRTGDILKELGKRGMVGGQEDMIVDVAYQLSKS